MTQEQINREDLRELKFYYGSWDALREVIASMEENENEESFLRHEENKLDAPSIHEQAEHMHRIQRDLKR